MDENKLVNIGFVEQKVLVEFKKAVLSKYGKLRGCYKKEIEKAIRNRTKKLNNGVSENECREQNLIP